MLAIGAAASARSVVHPEGKFRLAVPDDFQVKLSGPSKGDASFRMTATSPNGNVRVFVRSEPFHGGAYDFGRHFTKWSSMAKWRGWYRTLTPLSRDPRSVRGNDRVAYYRVYDGTAVRKRHEHPYRVYVLAAQSRRTERLYTVAISAQRDFFLKNEARLLAIAGSFAPAAPAPRPVRRVSLRGLLRRKGPGVAAPARTATPAPATRPVPTAGRRPDSGPATKPAPRTPKPAARAAPRSSRPVLPPRLVRRPATRGPARPARPVPPVPAAKGKRPLKPAAPAPNASPPGAASGR
jgi:hypothetical protein